MVPRTSVRQALFSPFVNTARGWHVFFRGLRWLRRHPFCLLLLFLPVFFGLGLLMLSWGYFYQYQDTIFAWLLFDKPSTWWGLGLYYFAKLLLYGALVVIGLIFYTLVVSVLASPLYEYVSHVVEKELSAVPPVELSLKASLLLMKEELKKVIFIMTLSLGLLFIPGLNLLAPFVTAFCAGWDLYDFPLARRGWSFRRRLGFVFRHSWSVGGLGLWLLIPGLQIFLMPLAVVGGTILAVEDLQNWEAIKTRTVPSFRVH